jgi:hypothetical protein
MKFSSDTAYPSFVSETTYNYYREIRVWYNQHRLQRKRIFKTLVVALCTNSFHSAEYNIRHK